MSKPTPTSGPWKVRNGNHVFCGTKRVCEVNAAAAEPLNMMRDLERREANARLIAEAGTVFHETGLTPRELAAHRAELLEALEDLVAEFGICGMTEKARAAIASATGQDASR